MSSLTTERIFETLDAIFGAKEGFEVRSSKDGVYTIETDEHEGFNGESIKKLFEVMKTNPNLYLSQIFVGNSTNMRGQTMTLLDLNIVDTHTAFYGYKPDGDKAQGCCRICGLQTSECGHAYTTATQFIRNCHVCEWHDFCKSCKDETHGGDMCEGDLCITCYRREHGSD